MLLEPATIIMPGDTRRVVLRGEGGGRGEGDGRGNERNRTLLIDFFRQNRRRMRAVEINRERREVEDRRRRGGGAMRNDDDDDNGKKHSSFNLNFNLNFSYKPFT